MLNVFNSRTDVASSFHPTVTINSMQLNYAIHSMTKLNVKINVSKVRVGHRVRFNT